VVKPQLQEYLLLNSFFFLNIHYNAVPGRVVIASNLF